MLSLFIFIRKPSFHTTNRFLDHGPNMASNLQNRLSLEIVYFPKALDVVLPDFQGSKFGSLVVSDLRINGCFEKGLKISSV